MADIIKTIERYEFIKMMLEQENGIAITIDAELIQDTLELLKTHQKNPKCIKND